MDNNLSNKVVAVYDHGNYPEVAMRLAREFGKVYYFKPWKDSAPVTNRLIVGDGYDEIIRARNFFDIKDECDLFVFPDIYDGDLQLDLERQGKRVWGSRKAEEYEYRRGLFAQTLEEVGLPTVPYRKCVGITALRDYLAKHDDQWIKIEMRGDRETWHHENMVISTPVLDAIAYYYGPVKEDVPFYVFPSIDSVVEAAYDGYMVTSPDGKPQFPKTALLGYECKNLAHILAMVPYGDLAPVVAEVNEAFAPKLAERNFRSQWGTEIKDDKFLDATCRVPDPPGPIVLENVKNLGEIFWHGSVGELVEMDYENPFGVQVMIYSNWAGSNHLPIQIPKSIRRWVKLSDCFQQDGVDWIVPKEVDDPVSGWRKNCGSIVALGDSIEDAITLAGERCEMLTSIDTEAQMIALADCLKAIHAGEKQGIPFADAVPEPATVLDTE